MKYCVYNNSITAIERAVKERVLYKKNAQGNFIQRHEPTRAEFLSSIGSFEADMKKLSRYATPMTAMQFALSYQDRRREVYIKAAEDNKKLGFNDRLAIIKAFMKCEKYNFSKKIPVPRLIQPRDPRYLSETGRHVKPIEKNIYKNINKIFGYNICFKGLNALQRGSRMYTLWSEFNDPVAFGLDAKRFDQHVSTASLMTDHNIIKHFYPGSKHLSHILSLQKRNVGKARCADGYLSYKTRGQRASGDSNTSCGNVTICCAILYGISQRTSIKFRVANDGDDCVVICERRDYAEIVKMMPPEFAKAGFELEIEDVVNHFNEISFCQTQPVKIHGNYIMVRDPRVAIAKDAVSLKPLDNDNVRKMWMAAVGKGGLSLTTGCPVWQSYYDMFVRNSHGAKSLTDPTLEGGFFRLSSGMDLKNRVITAESRYEFWKAFGITPTEQEVLEQYYDNYNMQDGTIYKLAQVDKITRNNVATQIVDEGIMSRRFANLPLYGRPLP